MALSERVGYRSAKTSSALLNAVEISAWAKVDEAALPEEQQQAFVNRKKAIEMYLNGASDAQIRRKTGQSRANIYRIISTRCLKQNQDGQLNGWRGALPHVRVNEYTRKVRPVIQPTGRGGSGALKWLFASQQGRNLESRFVKKILRSEGALEHPRQPFQALFRWLIKELRDIGLESRGEWPFDSETMGYESIRRYVKKVLHDHPETQLAKFGGPDAVKKSKASDGTQRPQFHLFDRVECDAHKLDARMVVAVPSPHGGYEDRLIHRLWIIVIIEVLTRAVLGYHLCLRKECSAEDVLSAVKKALTLWTPRELLFSDDGYVKGAGFPSNHSADYLGACWNEFSVDGALANICGRVERPMMDIVGAKIVKPQDPNSFSSRRSMDDRPFVETYFRNLASRGMHRIASTTGSSHKDKRGRKPEEIAVDTRFQLEYAEELLDTLIANYNATPHSGLGYRSPLSQMDFLASRQRPRIRFANPGEVTRMVGLRKLCTLLGGEHSGKRPHFNFSNAPYSAEWLAKRPDLLGKKLWLQIENELDARWAIVSDSRGFFLGAVKAGPPWHLSPHTLYVRQSIRSLAKKRLIFLSSNCDAVEELFKYAEASPGKKLPVHPAYLEARRAVRASAEAFRDMQDVIERIPKKQKAPDLEGSNEISNNGLPQKTKPKELVSGSLPSMRIAKTW